MRRTLSRALQPSCPSRGAFDWGRSFWSQHLSASFLFSYVVLTSHHFDLWSGSSQVHLPRTSQMCTFSCVNTQTQIHTPSKRNGPFANLRGSEMNVLARRVFDIVETVCLDCIHVLLKKIPACCWQCVTYFNRSRAYFFFLPEWLICSVFTLRQICKLLPFLHPNGQSHNYSKLEQHFILKQSVSQVF